MKNTKHNAAKFFSEYWNISIDEAKRCNNLTIDLLVKYTEKILKTK